MGEGTGVGVNDDMLEAAKVTYPVETGPRSTGYVNPKHMQDDEPADEVVETPEAPRIGVGTRTRPIPTGDPGPRMAPTGGTEPFKVEIDYRREARELADKVWAQRNF